MEIVNDDVDMDLNISTDDEKLNLILIQEKQTKEIPKQATISAISEESCTENAITKNNASDFLFESPDKTIKYDGSDLNSIFPHNTPP